MHRKLRTHIITFADVRKIAPHVLTVALKPRVMRALNSRSMVAAMSGKVAAMVRPSG